MKGKYFNYLQISCSILVMFVLIFGGFKSSTAQTKAEVKTPIKIGVVCSLSGPGGVFGKYSQSGANMAAAELNNAGGILGRPIQYIFRDDRSNPEVALREARSLYMEEKVDFLVGGSVSSCTQAILPLSLEQKKIFMMDVSAAVDNVVNSHRYSFPGPLSSPVVIRSAVRYLAETRPDLKKWYILAPDYIFGHDMYKWFWSDLKKLNPDVEIVGEAWPKLGTTDFGPYVATIMAAKPQAVMSGLFGGDRVSWFKAAVPRGYYKDLVEVGPGAAMVENLIPPGELVPDGNIISGPFSFWAIDTPLCKAFLKNYYNATGDPYPGTSSAIAYMHAYLLKTAIEKLGKVDTEAIINLLEGMKMDTPAGTVVIDKCTHIMQWPLYVGISKRVPQYPFKITVNVKAYPGESVYLTCDELQKLRAAPKK